MKRILGALGAAIAFALIAILMFVVIEGATSVLLVFNDVALREVPTYAQYDESLGWAPVPGVTRPNFYGRNPRANEHDRSIRGGSVVISSQGYRNDVAFDELIPAGHSRVICSGDSFTFAAGVSNSEAWCNLFQTIDPQLEAVNMGVSGYGIGQAMLRYVDRAENLEHKVHIFAFISANLGRTTRPTHNGFGRPVVGVVDGELVVENVPVPRLRNAVLRTAQKAVAELRSVEFWGRLRDRLLPRRSWIPPEDLLGPVEEVSTKIFERVNEVTRANGARAVFVYLPTEGDFHGPNPWEKFVVSAMEVSDLDFMNLAAELRKVPSENVPAYFIPLGLPGQTHFSQFGNRWTAQTLHGWLVDEGLIRRAPEGSLAVGAVGARRGSASGL